MQFWTNAFKFFFSVSWGRGDGDANRMERNIGKSRKLPRGILGNEELMVVEAVGKEGARRVGRLGERRLTVFNVKE